MQDTNWFWVIAGVAILGGCSGTNKADGVFKDTYILCSKPAGSTVWENLHKNESDRSGAILESEYQISFAHQLVVRKEMVEPIENCQVFDRNNWRCGRDWVVSDGYMDISCGSFIDSAYCRLPLGWFSHTLVYVSGADSVCKGYSSTFDGLLAVRRIVDSGTKQ